MSKFLTCTMSEFGIGITAASSMTPARPVFLSNSYNSFEPSLQLHPKILTDFVNLYSCSFFIHLIFLIFVEVRKIL
ncbi:MAG: hypothetical protein ACFFA3_09550 [Promethearchaeota archaeon]